MVVATLPTRPPQIVLHPIGTGESRRLAVVDITNLDRVAWFPDGKHLLLTGATEGQPLRTYEMDLLGGKPQPLGPPDFTRGAVAQDGKRIAGRNASGGAVALDQETQKVQVIPGVDPQEVLQEWTADGQALIVISATPWEAGVYRVEAATGKRTLLQKVELPDKEGSIASVKMAYSEATKAYVYNTVRDFVHGRRIEVSSAGKEASRILAIKWK